ncbi:hypothetical protein EVG20_g1181 [Dentipellis fragilis]|uniref:Uncharacterized protein n=1 Tax=Dentipellis fragilis TaxID=205917 RepID=A0A4Y9ZCD7_9AGAM|nr:hypothetical protein EVG20_g1181 [Dentipellis fragilis]
MSHSSLRSNDLENLYLRGARLAAEGKPNVSSPGHQGAAGHTRSEADGIGEGSSDISGIQAGEARPARLGRLPVSVVTVFGVRRWQRYRPPPLH